MSKTSNKQKLECLGGWIWQLQREKNNKGNTKKQRDAKPKFQRRYKTNY